VQAGLISIFRHHVGLRELALEEKRFEAEIRRIDMKAQERAAERDARYKERDMELRRMELELDIKKTESPAYQRQRDNESYLVAGGEVGDGDFRIPIPDRWEESLAGRTKRFGDTFKHILPHIPQKMVELPQFFDTVEKLFNIY